MSIPRVAILKSRFNAELGDGLVQGALKAFETRAEVSTFEAPGAFELPIIALEIALTGKFDGIVAIGAVIEGDTAHFEHIATNAAQGLMQVGLTTRVPVAFGVLTTYTLEQAQVRSHPASADNKGAEAAHALLATIETLRAVR